MLHGTPKIQPWLPISTLLHLERSKLLNLEEDLKAMRNLQD
uniref:Uncharacterized protein n=1 Tax=Anguilla anguilla TaxID=7936 RepID=A0A0E9W4U1_ANGAN